MVSYAPGALFASYTLLALLFSISGILASAESSPKVFGLQFRKQTPRHTPLANRLRRRQNSVSVDLDNEDIAYIINMTVGTPPQQFEVQLDTGSSDIWIPSVDSDVCSETQQGQEACQLLGQYDPDSSSSFQLVERNGFQIAYEDNSQVEGDYINETLTLNDGKVKIQNMRMGLALRASRPFGIMGIGYNADESVERESEIYPNIISQLRSQSFIKTLAYSLWLNDLDSATGSILFGGVDTEKYHGDLIVLPVQNSSSESSKSPTDFTVALSSVSLVDASGKTGFSQENLALPVILDSGTTATYLPDNVINPIISGMGAVNDPDFGLIIPCALSASAAHFSFGFGGNGGPSIDVSISEFVMPIVDNYGRAPTFKTGEDICGFGLMSSGTGPILFGDTFLRSAYVVYDLTSNQIGMAQTNFNATSSNVVEFSGSAIPSASATATGVAVTQTYTGHPQETAAETRAPKPGVSPTHGSPTFNLGASATGGSNSQGKKSSGAASLERPRMEAVTIVTGMVCLISLVFGTSLVFMA